MKNLKIFAAIILMIATSILIYKEILQVWMGIIWVISAWYLLMQINYFKTKK